jgi:radical SAM protein with 4Fe4S-binding SPASM domain
VLRARARAEARGVELIWYSPLPLCLFNTVAHGLGNRGCAAADGLLHVSPAGEVLPCSSFRHDETLGNLLRQPFEEIWRSRAACFFRAKEMMPAACFGCAEAAYCQGACVLYWREMGLAELGRNADERPPLPAEFGHGPVGRVPRLQSGVLGGVA